MRKKKQFSVRNYIFIVLGSLIFAVVGIATASSLNVSLDSADSAEVAAFDSDSNDILRGDRGYPPPIRATKTPRGLPTPTDEPDPYPDPPTPTPGAYPDPPTPTPEPTEDPYPYPDPPTPTPNPADEYPVGTKIRVYDIDIFHLFVDVDERFWITTVDIAVETENGFPLENVTIEGFFSNQPARIESCVNRIHSGCYIQSRNISLEQATVEFVVTHVEHSDPNPVYDSQLNYDQDNDSNGTTIIISRPEIQPEPRPTYGPTPDPYPYP